MMGVLICPACGHKVSEHAECCPQCGCKIDFIKKAPVNKDADRTGYREDAQNGDAYAMAQYAECLEFGENCDVNLDQALYWAKKSYENEDGYGCYKYAHLIWEKGCRIPEISNAENLKNALKAALDGVEIHSTACISFLAEVFSNSYYFSNSFLAGYYHMMLQAYPFIEDEDLDDDREDWEKTDFDYCTKRVKEEFEIIYKKIDSFSSPGGSYDRAQTFAKNILNIKPGTYGASNSISFKELIKQLRLLKQRDLTEDFVRYLLEDIILNKKLKITDITFNLEKTPEEKLLESIFKEDAKYIQTDEEAFEILKKTVKKVQGDRVFCNLDLDYKYSIPFMGKGEKSTHIYGIMLEAKKAVEKNDKDYLSRITKEQKEVLRSYTKYENY